MYRESILNGKGMCSNSDKMIAALEKEIAGYNNKIQALTDFSNLDILGESAEALKEKNNDLIHIIEKLIEADKLDIRDFKAIKERVGDTYINGEEVLDNIETARRGAAECYDRADSLWQASQKATYPWEADSLRSMSYASKSQGERWDRIKDFWIGRANLYDEIDNDTASLFTESLPLHRQAGTMLNQFMQCRLTATPTKGNPSRNLSGNGTKYNEAEEYVKDYLKQHGMTEEEIAKIDLNLLSSLYATLHWSTKDAETIIKRMLKEIYPDLYNYLKNHYKWGEKETIDNLYKAFIDNRIDSLKSHYEKAEYDDIDDIFGEKSNIENEYPIKFDESVVYTREEMYKLPTYDLLARCIYQEKHQVKGQEKVAWSIINRFFSDKNFTRGREVTLRNILTNGGDGGQYESLDVNNPGEYNAYHPDFNSDGWRNAKKLAYIIYSVIQDEEANYVDERVVIDALTNSENVYGDPNINTIGNKDSFYSGYPDNIYYSMGED